MISRSTGTRLNTLPYLHAGKAEEAHPRSQRPRTRPLPHHAPQPHCGGVEGPRSRHPRPCLQGRVTATDGRREGAPQELFDVEGDRSVDVPRRRLDRQQVLS